MKYRIRLIAEAGPDPLTGEPLEGCEEVVEVEADSLEHARRRAPRVMTMRLMGQLLRFYDEETGEEIESDEEPPSFRRATLVLDGLPRTYPGITRGEHWNGWAVPHFEKDVALRIAEDYEQTANELSGDMVGARARYDEEADAFVFYDPINQDEMAYYAKTIEVNGEELDAYPIGAREWTWEEV
jgi:hypothetical protein